MMTDTAIRPAGIPVGRTALPHDLIALVKFRYHITFVNVVFGALIFASTPDLTLAGRLVALYLSFNVLMYGGIYTLNDWADREDDARHPQKRHRPLAARRITPAAGLTFAAAMITAGLAASAALFEPTIVSCQLAALGLNLLYSFGGRNIRYIDLALNSAPHVVRFLMGVLLVGRLPPAGHLIGVFLLAIILSCLRRHVERGCDGWCARPTLSLYGRHELAVIAVIAGTGLVALAVGSAPAAPGYWGILMVSAAVLTSGVCLPSPVRRTFAALWLR